MVKRFSTLDIGLSQKDLDDEIEAAMNAEGETLIAVPTELIPEILKLINKKRPA